MVDPLEPTFHHRAMNPRNTAMENVDPNNSDHAHANRMRPIMLAALAVALITWGASAVGIATAQQNQSQAKPPSRATIEAPIGHRQPRAQDLPRSVLQNEGSRTEGEIELDRKLNDICRGC
jgi:hypothetical protein